MHNRPSDTTDRRFTGSKFTLACLFWISLTLACACDDGGGETDPDDTARADVTDLTADTRPSSDVERDSRLDTAEADADADTRSRLDADGVLDTASDTGANDSAGSDTGADGDTVDPDGDGDVSDVAMPDECEPIDPTTLPDVDAQRYDRHDVVESFPGDGDVLDARKVDIYLPEGYDAGSQRYPVLYMQDGQNLFDPAQSAFGVEWQVDETIDRLVTDGTIEPWIVVGIHATGARIDDYTPWPDPMYGGGNGDAYIAWLNDTLRPWVESRYRVACGPENTAVAGSSLGGLISWHIGLEHPDVFGRVAAISPSFWWNGRQTVTSFEAGSPTLPARLWIDAGSAEGTELETGETNTIANARAIRDRALELGAVYGRDVGYLEVLGGTHDEAAWAARLDQILGFLLKGTDFSAELGDASMHVYAPALAVGEASQTSWTVEYADSTLTWPANALTWTFDRAGVATSNPDGTLTGASAGVTVARASMSGMSAVGLVEVGGSPTASTVRFEVDVPAGTDAVHVSGGPAALGAWDGVGVALDDSDGDGVWVAEVELPHETVGYKYTRGDWASVEKDAQGGETANRVIDVAEPMLVRDAVASWAQ